MLAGGIAWGCAAGGTQSQGDNSSSGDGAAGGAGGVGGEAGVGGEESPCDIDCTQIQAPDACNEYQCNPVNGKCEIVAIENGTECDDGAFCTVGETCNDGQCTGGYPNTCAEQVEQCYVIECNEIDDVCTVAAAADGTSCTSGDACMINSKCQNGLCIGAEKNCFFADLPAPNGCWTSKCNVLTGECAPTPVNDGGPCFDTADLCTVGKTCNAGACSGGTSVDCSAYDDGCKNGLCDPSSGVCFPDTVSQGEVCFDGANDCNAGACAADNTCELTAINQSGACDDGNLCTTGETCDAGVCGSGSSVTQTVYFEEGFTNNTAGWTLGTQWTIGAATASVSHEHGNPDPDTDYTTDTTDNGIAGVSIGGNASTAIHSAYYLTSPPIDTSGASGSVWLGYRRWLNSDYAPYMVNTVEVFDGIDWTVVWQSGTTPGITDSSWTLQLHELTNYKDAAMQIRFGVAVGDQNVLLVSSWNLDDVIVANVVCSD